MRKMAIIISLVSFVCLGTGLIIHLLSKPEELLSPALPWRLTSFFLIAGDLMLLVAMLFYILYQYRQGKTKERQFKQWGIVLLTNKDLLRSKREEMRPYKREVWLLIALFTIIGLLMTSKPALDLILRQVFPLPSGSDTPLLYSINMHNYEQSITQIEVFYNFLTSLGTSACISVFTFLSREFPKKLKITKH